MFAYAGLALTYQKTFSFKKSFRFSLWASLILVVLLSLADEWLQTIVPGRTGSWDDVATDSIAAALALLNLAVLTQNELE